MIIVIWVFVRFLLWVLGKCIQPFQKTIQKFLFRIEENQTGQNGYVRVEQFYMFNFLSSYMYSRIQASPQSPIEIKPCLNSKKFAKNFHRSIHGTYELDFKTDLVIYVKSSETPLIELIGERSLKSLKYITNNRNSETYTHYTRFLPMICNISYSTYDIMYMLNMKHMICCIS